MSTVSRDAMSPRGRQDCPVLPPKEAGVAPTGTLDDGEHIPGELQPIDVERLSHDRRSLHVEQVAGRRISHSRMDPRHKLPLLGIKSPEEDIPVLRRSTATRHIKKMP